MTSLEHGRSMLRNSKLLRNIGSHICFSEEILLECLSKHSTEEWKAEEWKEVDVRKRKSYLEWRNKEYESAKGEDFMKHTYQFVLSGSTPIDKLPMAADCVIIRVDLFADLARVTMECVQTSRDVGYERIVVASYMNAVTTGEWLKKHKVYPSVAQFEKALLGCLVKFNVPQWQYWNENEGSEEDEESQTKCDTDQEKKRKESDCESNSTSVNEKNESVHDGRDDDNEQQHTQTKQGDKKHAKQSDKKQTKEQMSKRKQMNKASISKVESKRKKIEAGLGKTARS